MPSGMTVTAKFGCYKKKKKGCFLDIALYPLAEDFENSEGLCGNFNNNKDDDLIPKGSTAADNRKEPVDFAKSYMSVNLLFCSFNVIINYH